MIRTHARRFRLLLGLLASLVLLVANGCGDPSMSPGSGTESPLPMGSGTRDAGGTAIPQPSGVGTSDPTILVAEAPSDDPDQLCSLPSYEMDATLIADLGLEEGTQVAPNARYRETWRLRNTGACPWPEGTELVFISGDPIPGPQRAPVSPVGPGRDVDISVELTAPKQPARYASYWRLQAPGGQLFGAVIYAGIMVSSDAVAPVTMPDAGPRSTPTLRPVVPTATSTTPAVPTPPRWVVPTPTRSPTPVALPTSTSDGDLTCSAPDPRFEPVIRQARILGIDLPCITSAPTTERGVVQAFWLEIASGSDQPGSDQLNLPARLQSLVIVREATQTLYVLRGKDTTTYQAEARAYKDTWTSAMPERPETCAPLVPPPEYIMPTKSIGRLWCEQSLWNSIGWPMVEADAVTLVTQGDRNKLLVHISSEGVVSYLAAIDLDARAATVYQAP